MPTNRRRRTRDFKGGVPRLEAWMEKALLTGSEDASAPEWDRWRFFHEDGEKSTGLTMSAAWRHYGPALLASWIKKHPGSRPYGWWRFDAPGPRQRVGGAGEGPEDESVLDYTLGIPSSLEQFEAVDPEDPPRYESQAAYLDRHGLLTASERRALEKRPQAYEPAALTLEVEAA